MQSQLMQPIFLLQNYQPFETFLYMLVVSMNEVFNMPVIMHDLAK